MSTSKQNQHLTFFDEFVIYKIEIVIKFRLFFIKNITTNFIFFQYDQTFDQVLRCVITNTNVKNKQYVNFFFLIFEFIKYNVNVLIKLLHKKFCIKNNNIDIHMICLMFINMNFENE